LIVDLALLGIGEDFEGLRYLCSDDTVSIYASGRVIIEMLEAGKTAAGPLLQDRTLPQRYAP